MSIQQQIKNRVRLLNKHFLNRVLHSFAGASRGPFALVYHVGRRSGKSYETPIIVEPSAGGFVIALTYGPEVDWYRNVVAAGQCRILWHKKEYAISRIEPLDKKIALPAFPQPFRVILKILGPQHFVKMRY